MLTRDTDAPPKDRSFPIRVGGQVAWVHSGRGPYGYLHTFDALALPGHPPRKVHVLLPHGYGATDERLRVLYAHDGHEVLWPSKHSGQSWDVRGVLAEGVSRGALPRMLVVAVEPHDRNREYTHLDWMPNRTHGGLGPYIEYLAQSLKPFLDAHYRTLPEPEATRVVGSSHGGLAALACAVVRPDRFGGCLAMSPSVWAGLDDRATGLVGPGRLSDSALVRWATPGLREGHPRLYLDWGLVRTGGEHNALLERLVAYRGREFVRLLERDFGYVLGADLHVVEDAQGEHNEISWGRRLGPALALSYFGRPQGA